ncbi:clasp N terminal-domain-containing protein [Flagelloscypha sp. PMI_526]|nr:clasp N terminal-domain-containing protein [Flagelloscypha sp. PMI_526]
MADEEAARIEALLARAGANDVDVRVDALSKLEAEFEQGIQIQDSESILNVLKTCLRTSNQHLTTAAVSAIVPFLPLLVPPPTGGITQMPSPTASTSTSSIPASTSMDIFILRHALNAFLPTGGLIERLGDREKIQLKAREALVILGGIVFRSGGPATLAKSSRTGNETPLMIFERFLRESGFGSKVWKVREQSIVVLAEIRRQHHLFPLRPFMPLLVAALEDTDAHVRDGARKGVIEIFSGPGVTDAARADLKKELTKKGVRKTIVDSVLSQLLGAGGGSASGSAPASREGSENGDAKPAYVPPSLTLQNRKASGSAAVPVRSVSTTVPRVATSRVPSRPQSRAGELPQTPTAEIIEIAPVYVASSRDLENEFARMTPAFEGKESEHNWADRERSIIRVRGMLKGDIHTRYQDAFIGCLKDDFLKLSLKGLMSLRTTLAGHASSLYNELAIALGHSLEPFCETLYTNLLKLSGFTKKIVAQHTQATVTTIMKNTSAQPRLLLPLIWSYMQEKNVQCRTYASGHTKTFLDIHGSRSKAAIEASGGRETLEKSIQKGLGDANATVRENARASFWTFNSIWPDRGAFVMSKLDSSSKKQLEKACPSPDAISPIASTPTSSTAPRKSSVAAAIAASRAKAKAIATAPPSLRHQATSATIAPGATVSRRPSSPGARQQVPRPNSPLRTSTSPATSPTSARMTSKPISPKVASPSSVYSPSKSTGPFSPPRPTASHSRTPSTTSSNARPESPSELSPTRKRLSSPLAFASNTSPSKRASVVRQSLAGLGTATSNGHHSSAHAPPSPPDSRTSPTSGPRSRPTSRPVSPTRIPGPAGRFSTGADIVLAGLKGSDDDSLLLAQAIPIPDDDSDSDEDALLSFSAPFEIAKAEAASRHGTPAKIRTTNIMRGGVIHPPKSASHPRSISPKSVQSRGPVSPSIEYPGDQSLVIEDALRATAEQAESAAERLLEELVPEDAMAHPILPPALVSGSRTVLRNVPSVPTKTPVKMRVAATEPPTTPANNRSATVLRQAALFQNSPAYNGRSSSLIDMLNEDKKQDSAWWLKRKAVISKAAELRPTTAVDVVEKTNELQQYITALEQDAADGEVLQKLMLFCQDNPSLGSSPPVSPGLAMGYPLSPSPSSSNSAPSLIVDVWEQNRNFIRLFHALLKFLQPSKSEDILMYGLMVFWELVESQGPLIEGHEGEVFSTLMSVRYCNKVNILEATTTIRDRLTATIEPVYGLTTAHGALKAFQTESLPSIPDVQKSDLTAAKTQTTAFGLLALGKFILRLPAEILEDELPRLRATFIGSLNETSVQGGLVVREAAAAAIIAAQLILRDEGNLFVLLDGLRDDKKNLLTYLFDKHGVRGNGGVAHAETGSGGVEKLEREMRRLDARTSTPSKSS